MKTQPRLPCPPGCFFDDLAGIMDHTAACDQRNARHAESDGK